MHFELTTPWGLFAVGYIDGVLLWIAMLTIAAAASGLARGEK